MLLVVSNQGHVSVKSWSSSPRSGMHEVKDLLLRCHNVVAFAPDPAQIIKAHLALGYHSNGKLQLLRVNGMALEAPGVGNDILCGNRKHTGSRSTGMHSPSATRKGSGHHLARASCLRNLLQVGVLVGQFWVLETVVGKYGQAVIQLVLQLLRHSPMTILDIIANNPIVGLVLVLAHRHDLCRVRFR